MKNISTLDPSISFYLDKTRKDKNGKYKVRLYVNSKALKKIKYYTTVFAFTEKEFSSIWETHKPRNEHKELRIKMQSVENKAYEIADTLTRFNFEDFERLLLNKSSTKRDINYYYSKTIEKFHNKGSISTAINYKTSLKCILRFHKKERIDFNDITVSWLERFEKHCVDNENKSLTTVSIYLRTLRTIFNDAKAANSIHEDIYPFGKRKYQIPASKNVKKALTHKQLKVLFTGQPQTPEEEKAKAFWFFSYFCNGMNLKDILNLKFKDLDGDSLTFIRAKTAKTNRNSKKIVTFLNEFTKKVIKDYGNINQAPDNHIFMVLNNSQTPEEQYRLVKNFVSMVNKNFLKYALSNNINEPISSYWARHSFTTMAIRNGASIEFVGEAIGHTNTKTTIGYFAGFENKTKKEFAKTLLNFD